MKVDFSKIQCKGVDDKPMMVSGQDGQLRPYNAQQEISNVLFKQAKDIPMSDLAHDIYHKGEVDLTPDQARQIKEFVDANFYGWVKRAVFPALDVAINYDPNKKNKK